MAGKKTKQKKKKSHAKYFSIPHRIALRLQQKKKNDGEAEREESERERSSKQETDRKEL